MDDRPGQPVAQSGRPGHRLAQLGGHEGRWGDLAGGPMAVAAKTAVAAGLSWFVAADLLGNSIPVFAPLAALLTVQVTIWGSVSRGLQRVLGVVVGVLLALGFARLAGIHAWSIALLMFVSLVLGRALRLGVQGAVQVPVSSLLVLVLGATTGGYGLDRVVDTAVGAACGVLVNLVFLPPTQLEPAYLEENRFAGGLVELLRSMAAGLCSPAPGPARYLELARRQSGEAAVADRAVARTTEATRWHPAGRSRRPAIEALATAMATLHLVERQVRGIARSLVDVMAPAAGGETAPALVVLSALVTSVADGLEAWTERVTGRPVDQERPTGSHVAVGPPATDGSSRPGPVRYEEVLETLRQSDLPAARAAAAISVAVDAARIMEELRQRPSRTSSGDKVPSAWEALFGPMG